MDVPLVIKPFGVSKPMTSVDESLRKFVEVERLEVSLCSHSSAYFPFLQLLFFCLLFLFPGR